MKYLILIISLFWSLGAHAQEGPALTFGASTLGATLEASYKLGPNFGLRGVAGYAGGNISSTFNGAPLSGTATIGGYGLLADVYLGGSTRLSTGVIAPNYGADMRATGNITVNGSNFTNVDITASLDQKNTLAPMIVLGYQKTYASNWGISADIGAIYAGGFSISATDNSNQIPQADIDAELAETNTDLGQITVLPYVKLGVSFQF